MVGTRGGNLHLADLAPGADGASAGEGERSVTATVELEKAHQHPIACVAASGGAFAAGCNGGRLSIWRLERAPPAEDVAGGGAVTGASLETSVKVGDRICRAVLNDRVCACVWESEDDSGS